MESPATKSCQEKSYPFTRPREVYSKRDSEKDPGIRHTHGELCPSQPPEQQFCHALERSDDSGPWREAKGLLGVRAVVIFVMLQCSGETLRTSLSTKMIYQ